jgi:hypothetical protein
MAGEKTIAEIVVVPHSASMVNGSVIARTVVVLLYVSTERIDAIVKVAMVPHSVSTESGRVTAKTAAVLHSVSTKD